MTGAICTTSKNAQNVQYFCYYTTPENISKTQIGGVSKAGTEFETFGHLSM